MYKYLFNLLAHSIFHLISSKINSVIKVTTPKHIVMRKNCSALKQQAPVDISKTVISYIRESNPFNGLTVVIVSLLDLLLACSEMRAQKH